MSSAELLGSRERGRPRRAVLYPVLKRTTDIAIASLMLVLAGPLILGAAALIRLISPGSPFIQVPRIGFEGQPILIHKLRTMHLDAERLLDEYLKSDPAAAEEWSSQYKLKSDPRVIPYVGAFLRKASIDELPQLVDVLAGRMSLVGPRPFPDYHLRAFDASFCELRSSVLPGLTGLWQVECRNAGGLNDQIHLDRKYVEQRSYLFDLVILLRTPFAVLSGRSAY
jgi:lipopolysaccharide/colanic/teichoic acid biosynthesis glycosyltransferase